MARRRTTLWDDPLFVAALAGLLIVGIVVMLDLVPDGKIDPSVMALFVSVFGPLTPSLLLRYRHDSDRRNGNGHDEDER